MGNHQTPSNDPLQNLRAALQKYREASWGPWVTPSRMSSLDPAELRQLAIDAEAGISGTDLEAYLVDHAEEIADALEERERLRESNASLRDYQRWLVADVHGVSFGTAEG